MKTSLKLGLLTLVLFGGGGYLLIEFTQNTSLWDVLFDGKNLINQLLAGTGSGLVASLIAISIISRKFFASERDFYHGLIARWNLSYGQMIFLSWCAGIGEELFFRGGLQPLLGNIWTSVLFVFLHGYLNPRNWRISIYGGVMVGIIYGFGLLFEHVGLISAMIAHAILDMVLFRYLDKYNKFG
ncbi:MAG TPA: CPBP family intramembrane glutamic endopeptidase [Membranihabitans sp.]|nr:CPBP family intramembrane glutamic endopeptidase [Membranihabitans sp.]